MMERLTIPIEDLLRLPELRVQFIVLEALDACMGKNIDGQLLYELQSELLNGLQDAVNRAKLSLYLDAFDNPRRIDRSDVSVEYKPSEVRGQPGNLKVCVAYFTKYPLTRQVYEREFAVG